MKKIVAASAAVALAAGISIGAAAPASAYTYKENKVWSWVKMNAPYQAQVVGKRTTIKMARLTCEVLNDGSDIYDVIDAIGNDGSEDYYEFAAALTVSAIHYICPRHQWQLDAL